MKRLKHNIKTACWNRASEIVGNNVNNYVIQITNKARRPLNQFSPYVGLNAISDTLRETLKITI